MSDSRGTSSPRPPFAEVVNLESVFRNKWLGFAAALVVLSLVFLFLQLRERTYQSSARLFVRLGRESVTVDPLAAATGQVLNLSDSQQREIQSVMDIFGSRGLMEQVVDDLSVDQILNDFEQEFSGQRTSSAGLNVGTMIDEIRDVMIPLKLADPQNRRAEAIKRLGSSVQVSAEAESNVINLDVRATSPRLAQRIGESVLAQFREWYLRAHRAPGSYEFFLEQTNQVEELLEADSRRLRDLKNEAGFVSIESHRNALSERLRLVESEMLSAIGLHQAAQARVADMQTTLDELPQTVVAEETTGLTNTARDELRGQLYSVELELAQLRSVYRADHPLVIQAQQKLAQAQSVFGAEDVAPQVKRAKSLAYQQIEVARLMEQANDASARARLTEMQQQRDAIVAEIRDLNSREVEVRALQRRIDVQEQKFRRYSESLEQSRIEQALAADRLSSINVLQAPTFNDDAVDFGSLLISLAGLGFAGFVGVSTTFVREYLRNDLSTSIEVEKQLGLPVLATIPASRRQRVSLV